MSVMAPSPYPTLGLAVRAVRAQQRAEQRAAKRVSGPMKWTRRVFMLVAVAFALLAIGGGTAQAYPWDVGNNIEAFITYFCAPLDIPLLSTVHGIDTSFGLNAAGVANPGPTILPNWGATATDISMSGLERLNAIYQANASTIAHPTYERYGFSTLRWTNYGANCFGLGYTFTGGNNMLLDAFVKTPMILGMVALQYAMDNVIYDAFTTIISPIISVFTAIFQPWMLWLAPLGIVWAFVRSKGSPLAVTKVAAWIVLIVGAFMWMGNNTSRVVTVANNFVTEFASGAACQITTAGQGGAACDPDDPLGNINQALWYGVPYNVWLQGEVGEEAARNDRLLEQQGQIGWGPAILNGLYVAAPPAETGGGLGQVGSVLGNSATLSVQANRLAWNNASYGPNGAGYKTDLWSSDPDKSWGGSPFLSVVKAMCNDNSAGTESDFGDGTATYQRWMYAGNCDSAGAGAAAVTPHFTGNSYSEQLVGVFSGWLAAIAVALSIGVVSIYLALQKMMFYFLLAFGPIFLAIASFGDEKRRAFAIKFFERLLANVIKQCVAVCVVLFVAYSMSALLYPTAASSVPSIPWIVRPFIAILFFIALVVFAIPLRNIVTAGVKGDTSVVDKVAEAPKEAAKAAAAVAAVAGVAVATGGTSLGGAALGAGGKAGALLTQAGRMAGSRGGIGKGLQLAGRGLTMKDSLLNARAQSEGTNAAQEAGIAALSKNRKYQTDAEGNLTAASLADATKSGKFATDKDGNLTAAGLAAAKAAPAFETDKDGNLTRKGLAEATKEYNSLSGLAAKTAVTERARKARMDQFYAGYEAKHGQKHTDDPTHPDMVAARQVDEAESRQKMRERVDQETARRLAPATPEIPEGDRARMGWEVEAASALSKEDAIANPSRVLTDGVYADNSAMRMDPMHPATEALNALRLANASGSEEEIAKASEKASALIAEHGLPSDLGATGRMSVGEVTADDLNLVMKGIPSSPTDNLSSAERASLATDMQVAVSMLPEGHAGTDAIAAYAQALINPEITSESLEQARIAVTQAMEGFDATQVQQESTSATFAANALSAVAGPTFSRNSDVTPIIEQSAQEVLAGAGLSRDDVASNPFAVLSGDAYAGGDTMRMDPTHPATSAFTALRLAGAMGTDEEVEDAMLRAGEAVSMHGVPNEVRSVFVAGDSARTFDPATILGAITALDDGAGWQERAEAAVTMQAAAALMPEFYPQAETVNALASALANPSVSMNDVEALRVLAVEGLIEAPDGAQFLAQPESPFIRSELALVGAPVMLTPDDFEAPTGQQAAGFPAPKPVAQAFERFLDGMLGDSTAKASETPAATGPTGPNMSDLRRAVGEGVTDGIERGRLTIRPEPAPSAPTPVAAQNAAEKADGSDEPSTRRIRRAVDDEDAPMGTFRPKAPRRSGLFGSDKGED